MEYLLNVESIQEKKMRMYLVISDGAISEMIFGIQFDEKIVIQCKKTIKKYTKMSRKMKIFLFSLLLDYSFHKVWVYF